MRRLWWRRLALALAAGSLGAFASSQRRTAHSLTLNVSKPADARRPEPRLTEINWAATVARVAESAAFGPASETVDQVVIAPVSPNEVPRLPPIILRGIVGGPPWLAVVDSGGTGGSAVILQRGDRFAGARIQSISRTAIIVRRRDSTLTLSLTDKWR